MKERYLALMEHVLGAYTNEHIRRYFNEVKQNDIAEHGFPRLTANIGVLIAHGRREDLRTLFYEMMSFCCKNMAHNKAKHGYVAGNDFSMREIVTCLMAVEEYGAATAEQIAGWKADLRALQAEEVYSVFARDPQEYCGNWALFTAVSEWMRQYIGLVETEGFVDIQLATQLRNLDENGMYKDAPEHPPMVYDAAPRGLFSFLLHFGYRGRYYKEIDDCIRKAALLSLQMQSITGEMPFGGRSNQFLHNETWLSVIFEYEARRYAAEGDIVLSGRFKAAAERAVDNVEQWLACKPIHHVKNRFPLETQYGCEDYAYFDKYMITAASFLYMAYLMCDDTLAVGEFDASPMTLQLSKDFQKLFLRAGDYAVEWDLCADLHYDCSGLGRVHKVGAPSTVCLSCPCPPHPNFTVDLPEPQCLSLCPGVKTETGWQFANEPLSRYEVLSHTATDTAAEAMLRCYHKSGAVVEISCVVDADGVTLTLSGEGEIACLLPAFCFDGEQKTTVTATEHSLTVVYRGYACRYVTDGTVTDAHYVAGNRNGHYQAFYAAGTNSVTVKIAIEKE